MDSKELVQNTIQKREVTGNAFWVGHPADETKEIYYQALGVHETALTELEQHNRDDSVLKSSKVDDAEIEFNLKIGSDMIWVSPEFDLKSWRHPEGKPMWDCFKEKRVGLGDPGVFAECDSLSEVEAFDWPDPGYLDFSASVEYLKKADESGLAVFGGMWCPFFHVICDFFGMENYFIKMYDNPKIVHAVTERVVDFYVDTNSRFLPLVSDRLVAGFFGNDLGTQLDLMISEECFDEFILPYIKRIIATIKGAGLKVALHSCGAIDRIIPKLIEAGVDILHPIQALAKGMDAGSLAAKYGKDLIFMGGVDTQQLLPFGTPEQVREEVLRLREVFGEYFIVSPSHEAILPNVPIENVQAMSATAKE